MLKKSDADPKRAQDHARNIELCSRLFSILKAMDSVTRQKTLDALRLDIGKSWHENPERAHVRIQDNPSNIVITYDCYRNRSGKQYDGTFTFSDKKAVIQETRPHDPNDDGPPYKYFTRHLVVENNQVTCSGGPPNGRDVNSLESQMSDLELFVSCNISIPEITDRLKPNSHAAITSALVQAPVASSEIKLTPEPLHLQQVEPRTEAVVVFEKVTEDITKARHAKTNEVHESENHSAPAPR